MRSCISIAWVLTTLFTSLGFVNAQTPTTPVDSGFVKSQGGKFTLDGKPFHYLGTNAYWLQLLNKEDINKTMHDIAALGIKVVRTWAFNDVTEIPKDGVWLQVFHENGTIQINTGENGLVRLDNIVKAAKDNNLHVLFSLTNNWTRNVTGTAGGGVKTLKRQANELTPVDRNNLPHNYLSNDFGGMDIYNKHFLKNATDLFHDPFYTHPDILASFSRYVAEIVKRYANETSVFGWELANDPRCGSALPATNGCTPQTITKWTATIAEVVKQNDPNHLVATGDSGFYCVDCPKVFPVVPAPQSSPAPGQKRRRGFLTGADLRKRFAKRAKRSLDVRESPDKTQLRRVRGNWYAPRDGVRKRQSNSFGSAFDGSFGVDTEDLANTPGVDFSSLQFFPDQNTFGADGIIDLTNLTDIIQSGINWINLHAETANTFGQPVTVTSFGLLTNETENTFAPFNSTQEVNNSTVSTTQEQQVQAYDAWINAANSAGVNIIHYQWGQTNLTVSPAGAIRPQNTTTSPVDTQNTLGVSPDDGYAAYPSSPIRGSLARGAALFAGSTTTAKVRPRMDL